MKQYIEPGSLLIVGNRAEAHTAALENGAAVLISRGFGASEEVIRLANEMELLLCHHHMILLLLQQ